MANYVPKTGNFNMFLPVAGGAEDDSLESAIRLTIASGVRPTRIQNFGSLISNVPNYDLIDDDHGTKGSVPSQSTQFRGYPKPSISMNFETATTGVHPLEITQDLVCEPVLNNIVGFDVVISVQVIEEIVSVGIPQIHNETLTIAKGSTSVTSSTLPTFTGGKRRCNTVYRGSTVQEDITAQAKITTVAVSTYHSTTPYSVTLTYTAPPTIYSHTIETFPNASCGFFGGGTPSTAYSLNSTVNGAVLYSDALLTTFFAAGNYATNYIGDFEYDWFALSATGVVSGYTVCS